MKVHKVTVCVVDHDDLGADGVKSAMENVSYPNRCISPDVVDVATVDVEWHDRHPLNLHGQQGSAFAALFADALAAASAERDRLRKIVIDLRSRATREYVALGAATPDSEIDPRIDAARQAFGEIAGGRP